MSELGLQYMFVLAYVPKTDKTRLQCISSMFLSAFFMKENKFSDFIFVFLGNIALPNVVLY